MEMLMTQGNAKPVCEHVTDILLWINRQPADCS